MLEKEFQYYLDNQKDLVTKYPHKFIVIKGEVVVGVYNTEDEALFSSQKKHKEGTFLIQYCEEGDASYTQSFHSRVFFV